MIFKRPPLEERIAQRQRELGPVKSSGKYFDQRPAMIVFIGVIIMVVLTHVAAILIIVMAG